MINLKRVASVLGFAVASSVATTAYASSISANFFPDTIGPGSMSVLTLTFNNTGTSERGFDYNSTLPMGVVVADPSILSNSCGNSTLTATAGANSFSLIGGEIGAASSCAISLWVESAVVAAHLYTPDTITIGGITTSPASDTLTVDSGRPGVSLSFSTSSAFDGDDVALTVTYDNSLNGDAEVTNGFNNITLPQGLVISNNANNTDNCGTAIISSPGDAQFSYGSFSLGAGATCSISQNVKAIAGDFTVSKTSFLDAVNTTLGAAAASLNVTRNALSVQSPDPVVPGGTGTLDFTITNFSRSDSVADVDLTFDLSALAGVSWTAASTSGVCNSGTLTGTGTNTLTLANGSLAAEEVCKFSIDVSVPGSATPGTYFFSSTNFEFDNVTAGSATNNFVVIGAPSWTITPDKSEVFAGDSITLTFEAKDTSNSAVSDIFMQWHYPDELQLTSSLPSGECGGTVATQNFGSPSKLGASLGAGSLSAGGSCSFDLTFNVKSDLSSSVLSSQLLSASSTVGGQTVFSPLASFDLSILAAPRLAFDMPAGLTPGDSGTVGVTIEHSNLTNMPTAENIAFSVNLADFSSDISSSLTSISACGGTFTNTAGILSLSGGELLPGETCSFSFPITVGVNAQSSTLTANTQISAEYSASAISGLTQPITLLVSGLEFSMAFEDGMLPGQTGNLVYTFVNNSTVNAVTNIDFTHDLITTSLPDLTPNDGATVNTCGGTFDVNEISGEVSFNDADKGGLAAGETCTITVPVEVASGTAESVYTYSTSAISFDEGAVTAIFGAPATANLTISSPLSVTKVISKNVVLDSETLDITYTFTNNSSTVSLTNIVFTEDFASYLSGIGIVSYTAPDCAFSDSNSGGLLDLSNGSLGVNESCELTVQLSFPTVSGQVFVPAKSSDYSVVIGGTTLSFPGIQTNFTVVEDGQEIVTTLSTPSLSATNNGSVTYTVTFSNADSVNLLDSLVQLNTTGTASATTAVTDGTTNTATVTLSNISGDGTLGITILAGAARNGLGNSVVSQPSATFVVDNTAPVISFSSTANGTIVNNPITLTIDLSAETDTMTLTQADLVVVNATVQAFSLSNSDAAANITITPISDGAVSVTLPANTLQDAVGNNNTTQSISATYDGTPPTLNISSDSSNVSGAFDATFEFSEAVTGFDLSDISVTNGTVSNFNVISSSEYTVTVTPTNDGDVEISVLSGVASDSAGNTSNADSLTVVNETSLPSISLSKTYDVVGGDWQIMVTSSKPLSSLSLTDFEVTNANASGFIQTSSVTYSFRLSAVTSGEATVTLPANVVTDLFGNFNTASNVITVTFVKDTTAPSIVSLSPEHESTDVSISPNLSITFDESIQLKSGLIEIRVLGTDEAAFTVDETQINVVGTEATFKLSEDLLFGATYTVIIASGLFEDNVGNAFNGSIDWIFTTVQSGTPVANDENVTTDEDTSVVIDILDNDLSGSGEFNIGSLVLTEPENGVLKVLNDNTLEYTPNNDFNGLDGFEYSIENTAGERTNTASVSIDVKAVNDAPKFTTEPSLSAVVSKRYEYTIEVNDVDNEELTLSAITIPSWLTLDGFILNGTPEESDIEVSGLVELAVNDGELETTQSFTITVTEQGEYNLEIIQQVDTNNITQQQAFVLSVNIANSTEVEAEVASLTIDILGADVATLPDSCQAESTTISCISDSVITNTQGLSYQIGLTAQSVLEFVSSVTLVTTDEQSLSNQLALPISEEVDDGTGESIDGAKSIAFNDLNNDGFADFIFIGDKTLMLVLNDGKGGFVESTQLLSEVDINAIELVDLDNDGLLDIAFAGSASFGSGFMLNLGGLSFGEPTILTNEAASTLRFGDFAGDGNLGLLFVSSDGSNYEVFNPPFGSDSLQRSGSIKSVRKAAAKISDIQIADFNLDGQSDILVGYEQGNAVLLESSLAGYEERTLGISDVKELFITNIDSDARPDIIAATAQGTLLVTDFNTEAALLTNVMLSSLQVADVLGLDSVQIIGLTTQQSIAFVKQTATGYQLHNRNVETENASFVRAIDIDNDGDTDLVYGSEVGSQIIYNQGEGDFGKQTTDLVITSNVDKTEVEQEESLTWSIELSNQGLAQAENATLSVKVTNGQIDSVSAEQWQCNTVSESEQHCTLSNFATDSSMNVSITLKATTVGEMILDSMISSDRIDDNEANNKTELSVTVTEKTVVEPPVTEPEKKKSSGSIWWVCLIGLLLLPMRRQRHY